MSKALSAELRTSAIEAMATEDFDMLIIGGGVVGAGAALDAATRGYKVALVEARDWASGTSSRSSKLMHGGLRYLEMLDFRLVHEALIERGLSLKKLAPHLVRPVSFLYPLTHKVWERPYIGAGIALYDAMARTSGNGAGLPLHRHFGRKGLRKIARGLRDDAMHGAIRYYDAQVDDARHTFSIVRTAADHGAVVANRVSVSELVKENGRVVGAQLVDAETGKSFAIKARSVLNATGIWTDEMQALAEAEGDFHVRTSKGVHFIVDRDAIDLDTGLILRTEKSVLFVIPWGLHWIVGTTDTDYQLDKARPVTTGGDLDYLLEHVNAVLTKPITRADVKGTYAGLRPLIAGNATSTAKLSREHGVSEPVPGMVVIAGGKYTTYRVMAKDAVDATAKAGRLAPSKCVTEDVPLVGAEGYNALLATKKAKAKQWNILPRLLDHLLGRYGSLTPELFALIEADRALANNLPGTAEYIRAEVIYATTHEGAVHLEDVLARRTRMSFESQDRGVSAAPVIADLMGDVLGWDAKQRKAEVQSWLDYVAAEVAALEVSDDASAEDLVLAVTGPSSGA